jgi:transposase
LRVLAAVVRGRPRKELAKTFSVSLPSIKRWLLRKETGGLEPREGVLGPPAYKGAALEEWLPEQLKNNPDLTLEEHRGAFEEERSVRVSTATISRAIRRLPGQWPLEKSASWPKKSARRRRGRLGEGRPQRDRPRTVRVGGRVRHAHLHEPYERARAPKGERAYGKVPRDRGKNTTLIASMTLTVAMGASIAFEGATDKEVFEASTSSTSSPRRSARGSSW